MCVCGVGGGGCWRQRRDKKSGSVFLRCGVCVCGGGGGGDAGGRDKKSGSVFLRCGLCVFGGGGWMQEVEIKRVGACF